MSKPEQNLEEIIHRITDLESPKEKMIKEIELKTNKEKAWRIKNGIE